MSIDVVALARFLMTGIALLLAFLAVVTWNRRKEAPEATPFAALVAALAVYAFGYAGEMAQTTVSAAQMWLDVEYLALPWVPGLLLLSACRHNGLKARPALFFVIPLITFAGHFTNFHHYFYTAPMTIDRHGPFWVLNMPRGPLSILDNAYLLVAFLAAMWTYISRFRQASTLFRRQAMVLILSTALPIAGYFLYLGNLSPWGLDITPIVMFVSCALFYYGVFHCGIFDLAPLARNLIFNSIRDSVLILDMHDRLIDFNPSAETLLPALEKKHLGTNIFQLLAATPIVVKAIETLDEAGEFSLTSETGSQSYEIRTWPLFSTPMSPVARPVGRAVIFCDITPQVRLREELLRRAETDPLTGVANRRRFHQTLEIECLRYSRGHTPLSVLMIDIDNFKVINDRYGHPTGDTVLREVAHTLLSSLRKTDLLARYGGEEFAVLLPETREAGASIIAERIRSNVNTNPVEVDGEYIEVSVSVGLASHANDHEVDPLILLKKADLALYRAKATGRNRVEVV
jgi:diguanylate cyclase (GGDEF)-like protein